MSVNFQVFQWRPRLHKPFQRTVRLSQMISCRMIIFNSHYALFLKSECGKPANEGVYKNPQLVAQHFFVSNFGRCFPFFINLSHNKSSSKSTNQSAAFLQPATSVFCCGLRWSCKVKSAKHRPKLATKQCGVTGGGFLYLVFRHLKDSTSSILF